MEIIRSTGKGHTLDVDELRAIVIALNRAASCPGVGELWPRPERQANEPTQRLDRPKAGTVHHAVAKPMPLRKRLIGVPQQRLPTPATVPRRWHEGFTAGTPNTLADEPWADP